MKTIWDIEIQMMIPFTSMSLFPDDDIDEYVVNPILLDILNTLDIKFDPLRILNNLYSQDYSNTAIEVHYSEESDNEFLVIDTYVGRTDQLDFIYLMFRGTPQNSEKLRKLSHEFYVSTCPYNVIYEEGNLYIKNKFGIDLKDLESIDEKILSDKIKGKKIRFYKNNKMLFELNYEGKKQKFKNPNYR